MSGKQLAVQMTSAMDDASREALRTSIAELPSNTTLGALLDDLGSSRPAALLRSMPLGEIAQLFAANDVPGDNGARRAPNRRKAKRSATRTSGGSVRSYLRKAGKAKAEEIRAVVGGTPQEIRQALFELKDEKLVRRTGKGRATVWHWRS